MPDEGKAPEKQSVIPHIGGYKETRKIGFVERCLNRFFSRQALEPLIKGFLLDLLVGGINRMINGSNTPSAGYGSFQNLRQDYGRMFQNNLMQNQGLQRPTQPSNEFTVNAFPVESRAKAVELIDAINAAIRREGKVRVTEVNEAVDKPDRDWVDQDYGWYDITGWQIVPQAFGSKMIVVLPMPVKLKN